MAVPKKRTSQSKQGTRRSHHALTHTLAGSCTNCHAPTKLHNACMKCGYYRGRKVLKVA